MTWLLAVIIFAAAIVRGYTGFGLSAILITVVTHWTPAQELVPVLILLEITSSLLSYRAISVQVDWKPVSLIFIGSAISTPLALKLLLFLPTQITHLMIAGLVLVATMTLLAKPKMAIKPNNSTWVITGLTMGIFAGLGSIGGLAGMVMLLLTSLDAAKSRTLMIILLFTTSIYTALISAFNGMMNHAVFNQYLLALIPLIPGLYIGHLLFQHYQKSFRTITLILLTLLSVTMLIDCFYQLKNSS